jgi:Mg2+/Co2+ transporter CorB
MIGKRNQNPTQTKRSPKRAMGAGLHAIVIAAWAAGLALPVGLLAQSVLEQSSSLTISLALLLLVIAVGVVFDVIGVAVTAATEPPLHACASQGRYGAREAARLVRRAHQVASFCNDVVGDVSGTLSGALAISIVYQLLSNIPDANAILATTIVSALVAGLIVGGKAYGKVYAIHHSTGITLFVGRIVATALRLFPWIPSPYR